MTKKSNAEKTGRQAKGYALNNLIERYPGYKDILKSERHVYESFRKFPKKNELLQLIHLVECILSQFVVRYKSFDSLSAAEDCLNHVWANRDSFEKGCEFIPWLISCAVNYGRSCLKDNRDLVSFDSSDMSEKGSSVKFGRHNERNSITEKAQFNMGIFERDFISEQIVSENEEKFRRKKNATRKAHSAQLNAERANFKKALDRTLSEISPEARLLYDLYNNLVPFEQMYKQIGAKSAVAARVRRDTLVKTIEKKMINYWEAPKGYTYDDPLEPMRRLLMEITFIKGWSVNVTKNLRVR